MLRAVGVWGIEVSQTLVRMPSAASPKRVARSPVRKRSTPKQPVRASARLDADSASSHEAAVLVWVDQEGVGPAFLP